MYYMYVIVFMLLFLATEEISLDDEYHGYGTWHFVSIFLIISVIAIVGYFFVHNRKKV